MKLAIILFALAVFSQSKGKHLTKCKQEIVGGLADSCKCTTYFNKTDFMGKENKYDNKRITISKAGNASAVPLVLLMSMGVVEHLGVPTTRDCYVETESSQRIGDSDQPSSDDLRGYGHIDMTNKFLCTITNAANGKNCNVYYLFKRSNDHQTA
ncbi:hypothetical protein RR46_14148 [Papilio xuthus]|uniref:Uncharacterized protein n=1 Tax=Papilio xuthus TaxID=66420 RepID=A0A194PHY4_PAPXU|nr:hypothetical protein RR46_14148 [Papilio xuthus]